MTTPTAVQRPRPRARTEPACDRCGRGIAGAGTRFRITSGPLSVDRPDAVVLCPKCAAGLASYLGGDLARPAITPTPEARHAG